MIEMSCPSCGRAGQVPKEKLHTRLVCRKCHVVFHMDKSGRALLGEPHTAGPAKDPKKAKEGEHHTILETLHLPKLDEITHLGDNLSEYSFPVKPVLGVLGALVVGWLFLGVLNREPESVSDPSRRVVDALAHDNLDRLKSYASDETRDDVVRWYDVVHSRLEKARVGWPSKEAAVQILVVEEDHQKQKGVVEAFLMPTASITQAASVLPTGDSKSSAKAAAPSGPLGFQLHWVWTGGRWRLDGRETYALATR